MQNEFAGFGRPKDRRPSFRYCLDASVEEQVAVSVITVLDQIDRSLVELAQSLSLQSLQNIEWLVVVEGGGVANDDIFSAALACLPRGRVRLVSDGTRQAVKEAIGRYIGFVTAGSELDPTYLEKCVWFLDARPELAFCNTWSVILGQCVASSTRTLGEGLAYLSGASDEGSALVVHASIAKDVFENDVVGSKGLSQAEFLLAIAAIGRWGETIPEYLGWIQPQSSKAVAPEVQKLLRDRYPSLSDFTLPKMRDHQPYESLRTDSPIVNTLTRNTERLRILFVLPWMVTGGADKFNLDLVQMLTERGHEVTLCTTLKAEQQWACLFAKHTSDVFVLDRFLTEPDYPRFLSYLIKSRRVNTVVISGSTLGYQFLPYLRASSPDVSFMDLCHVEEPHWQNGGHPRFGVGYQDLLDINIVSTAHLAEWMTERGAERARIRVLHTGVNEISQEDTNFLRDKIRQELGIADDLPVIIYGGRICQQKRPVVLANILRSLRDTHLPFHALIVGDGDQREPFETMLNEYGLRNCVSMLGAVAHDRWISLLQASDVFLLPSDYEGISIALLEAMSVGVVPIVSDVGGQREIVREGAGYLIPHGDSEVTDYQRALESLLLSPSLRRQMGERAIDLIGKDFSKRSTIERFEAIVTESRHLLATLPRVQLPEKLAREFVTSAIELNRLNGAVNWLWGRAQANSSQEFLVLINWLLAFRKTKLGHALYQSVWLRRFLSKFCTR